ncbi:restriction endonuclease subunit S [Spirulina major CS-329]|uniref:restriction endonuclease subunit S n=1 Tax=Spirulina TaxID=1154 RepID=UPI00232BDD0B|nr:MULTISPECIES: restriction endonuclease subunit S [Spirulina]MDB9494656.1 restriction endonuclease subunit S [Spirulina subsalsa CS-330]MDB9503685.1 restriction endonuclease subunit S [Spirulina major CS-329]
MIDEKIERLKSSSSVPSSWMIVNLEDIGRWSSGGTPSRKYSEYYNGEIPWIKTGDLKDCLILKADEYITEDALKNSSAKMFPKSSLLVAMYGATIGKLGILNINATTNQACAALIAEGLTTEIIPFIFYYLLFSRENLQRIGKGGAQPNISQTVLKKYPCFLPPLNEQRRIVAKIEELSDRISKTRTELEAAREAVKQFRQSVLAAAFRGDLTANWEINQDCQSPNIKIIDEEKNSNYKLPDIADNWRWTNIGSVGNVKGGKRLPKGKKLLKDDTGYPYIRAGNLKQGTVIEEDILYISKDIFEVIKNYTVESGDIYITIVGACIGDSGIIPSHFSGASLTENAAKICQINHLCNSEYLALWLRSPLCQRFIHGNKMSGAQGKLALFRIKALPLPLPPLEEQKEIVKRLESAFEQADVIETEIKASLEQLKTLEQAILAKAFRGELVPQDPNDEPASELLKRIEAAKTAAQPQRKTPKQQRKR